MSRGWRSKFWLYGLSVGIQDDLRERCSIGLLLKKLVCLLVKAGLVLEIAYAKNSFLVFVVMEKQFLYSIT